MRTVASHEARRRRLAPAVFWDRRWAATVLFAACTGLTAVVMASGSKPVPVTLVLLGVVSYLVASWLPRRLSVAAVMAAAAALGTALLYAAFAVPHAQVAVEAVEVFLPLAAAWFVGDAAATRRRYLAVLAEQAERERTAEAERARREVGEERVRIARELHDVVAHALAVVTVQAGVGKRLMARRPEEASSALESIETIGRTAQEELRVVIGLLREEGIGAVDLSPAPRLADLKELAETVRVSGTQVELRMTGADHQLSPALELSIYRVVQEALTNVVKHAPGASATVGVAVSARDVRIEVTDDGPPTGRPAGPGVMPGHGIMGMRERIGAFGGSLITGPCPGGGFRVLAEVPLQAAP
jgi:signal transduction histidine kinase